MADQSTGCAACNFMRRNCSPDCVFAPHFPYDQPAKFVAVHEVFGESNVSIRLNELAGSPRAADFVDSIVADANAQLELRRKAMKSLARANEQNLQNNPGRNLDQPNQEEKEETFRIPYFPLNPDRNSLPHPSEELYHYSDFHLNPPEVFADDLKNSSGSDNEAGTSKN